MSNSLKKKRKKKFIRKKKLCRPTVPNFLAMLVETKNIFYALLEIANRIVSRWLCPFLNERIVFRLTYFDKAVRKLSKN